MNWIDRVWDYMIGIGSIRSTLEQKENQIQFIIYQSIRNPERGWYIRALKDDRYAAWFVWKDLELHAGTGWNSNCRTTGDGMGYYFNKETAKYYLKQFKEKYNMADQIEINVKVNGVETPLHQISELTLSKIREAGKPKKVPVARVADFFGYRRLILRTPHNIGDFAGKIIAIDLKNGGVCNNWDISKSLIHRYTNIQTIE